MSDRFFSRAAACFTAAALLAGGAARAADFPMRGALAVESAARGVGRPDLPQLRVSPGPGAAKTMAALTRKLADSGEAVTTFGEPRMENGKGHTAALWADGRSLLVYGDGTKVSFRNSEELKASTPAAERMSMDKLEQIGRAFIERELADQVRLGANEKLEAFSTRVQVGGGADVKSTARPEEQVLANAIVFTRTVDGVPVLGSGSKVAVLVTNDGKVAGFDFDWASFQPTGKRVKALGPAQIRERVKALSIARLDSPDVTVRRYECGLYDAGLRDREPQGALQGACLIHSTERKIADPVAYARDPNSGHVMSATIDVIPVGETVELDSHWPQAQKLLGLNGGDRAMPASPGPRP
ncbi:MAG TPA: hypothetical protein VIG99_00415 [Myxococcaceae bacterium]